MEITVIHGDMRTGKTVNATAFLRHYGCSRLLDGWPHDAGSPRPLQSGDLILTTSPVATMEKLLAPADIRFIDINTARAAIGLPPAPKGGFPVEPAARWWAGSASSVTDDGLYEIGDFATKSEAIAGATRELAVGDAFYVIQAVLSDVDEDDPDFDPDYGIPFAAIVTKEERMEVAPW